MILSSNIFFYFKALNGYLRPKFAHQKKKASFYAATKSCRVHVSHICIELYVIHLLCQPFSCLKREDGSDHWLQYRKTSRCTPSWHEAASEMQARLVCTSTRSTFPLHSHRGCRTKCKSGLFTAMTYMYTFENLIMSGIPVVGSHQPGGGRTDGPAALRHRQLRINRKK